MSRLPSSLHELVAGDTILFWPHRDDWKLQYGGDWKIGEELTVEKAESSSCRAKDGRGGLAVLPWTDVALPMTCPDTWTPKPKVMLSHGMEFHSITLHFPDGLVREMLQWVTESMQISPDLLVELFVGSQRLELDRPCDQQGLVDGATLDLKKRPAATKVGTYQLSHESCSETGFESWRELVLAPDHTCSCYVCSGGAGEGGEWKESKVLARKGTWSSKVGSIGADGVICIAWGRGEGPGYESLSLADYGWRP